jgi:hypothetical protein
MNLNELISDTYFLTSTDETTYDIDTWIANANRAMENVVTLILEADGRWQWDDANNASTSYPIGKTGVVIGQQDYQFSDEHLYILDVEIKDSSGNWYKLKPIDIKDFPDSLSIDEFFKGGGVPEYYDKQGNSLFLYPTPNYTQANSLKAKFQRVAKKFVPSNLLFVPGYAVHLHRYLSLSTSYDWALAKGTSKTNLFKQEMAEWAQKITNFYSRREKDEVKGININSDNFY